MKKRKNLICALVLMLIAIASLSSLLIRRGMIINEARREEAARLAEELHQTEEKVSIPA